MPKAQSGRLFDVFGVPPLVGVAVPVGAPNHGVAPKAANGEGKPTPNAGVGPKAGMVPNVAFIGATVLFHGVGTLFQAGMNPPITGVLPRVPKGVLFEKGLKVVNGLQFWNGLKFESGFIVVNATF